jgi:hypothetical protein
MRRDPGRFDDFAFRIAGRRDAFEEAFRTDFFDNVLVRSTWDAVGMISTSPTSASAWLLRAAMLFTGML